jgi:hypothetical protein
MASRRKVGIFVAAIAFVVVAAAIAIGVMSRSRAPDRVKVEIRARPLATIQLKGKNLGHTPLTVQLPRAKQQLTIVATFRTTKVNPVLKTKRTEIRTLSKTFVPDDHQSIDFDVNDAKLERTDESPIAPL